MNTEPFEVWLTRDALTKGILKIIVRDCGNGLVEEQRAYPTDSPGQYFKQEEVYQTEYEANMRALEMCKAELASLDKARDHILRLQRILHLKEEDRFTAAGLF